MTSEDFSPPFPECIVGVLERASLCYFATCEDSAPHLSLMNFSWTHDPQLGGLLIMTTRRDTKKYTALQTNPQVALLVHDFDQLRRPHTHTQEDTAASSGCGGGTCSITVYGEAVEAKGEVAERLRAVHLQRNSKYPQFIVGECIAVLYVQPRMARMCNINDCVSTWEANKSQTVTRKGSRDGL
eukprot:GDKI01024338.1.p1 GENE.GDKI01024338.1~~GDKI01024338.1.p1  ORF type:complete len:184 (-),score=47.69 GDKI01024338.1:24-575(-)